MEHRLAFPALNLYMIAVYYSNDHKPVHILWFNDGSWDLIGYYTVLWEF